MRDINNQIRKIQETIGQRVLQLEEQKEELDEMICQDALEPHGPTLEKRTQESQTLEYFLD